MIITVNVNINQLEKVVDLFTRLLDSQGVSASTNGEVKSPGRPKKAETKVDLKVVDPDVKAAVDTITPAITLEQLREFGNKVSALPGMTEKVKKVINDHGSANLKTADPKNYAAIWAGFEELEKSASVTTEL